MTRARFLVLALVAFLGIFLGTVFLPRDTMITSEYFKAEVTSLVKTEPYTTTLRYPRPAMTRQVRHEATYQVHATTPTGTVFYLDSNKEEYESLRIGDTVMIREASFGSYVFAYYLEGRVND
jgi:hypothetical protein